MSRVRGHTQAGRPALSSEATRDRILGIASPLLLILAWEAAARMGLIDTRFFPAPSAIFVSMISLAQSGDLLDNTWASLSRLMWGILVGGVPGVVIGIVMGLNRQFRAALDPLIAATFPIPKSALMPLALLILGIGEASKIFMVAVGVFYPVAINTTAGVLGISKVYMDVGRNFKASRWQLFTTIALPGALPIIMTGIKLGVGMGLVLIAVAEMVGAKNGLGYMVWSAWETFAVEQMYVSLFVIAMIGFLSTVILNEIERILVPWKAR